MFKEPYSIFLCDPPWSDGPPEQRAICAACGEERYESDSSCGGCGFKWAEIELAERIAKAVLKKLGMEDRLREVIDAVLGEFPYEIVQESR